ncbi:MAG: gamma-glutamyltransferase [Gammaproteobacteria bacterium]|nr:MAG: gamma-glutamyltransferase [Gammaproteobacteria bacterium]
MSSRLAVAASSSLAAAAGAAMAEAGGNAVDAALAAILVAVNTEPGICSLACGGYLTVKRPGRDALTLDGYVAVPGRGLRRPAGERLAIPVHLEYGGGVDTVIGPDTVGVPGAVALFGEASREYGRVPWPVLFEPVIDCTRRGFPLPPASYHYLEYSAEPIFCRSEDGRTALCHPDGRLKEAGETVVVPHLADTLNRIARNGPDEFYTGELGRGIAAHVQAAGGRLSEADLAAYEVLPRPSLKTAVAGWEVASNPPPAIGGAVLSAMLQLLSREPIRDWDRAALARLVDTQRAVLDYRRRRLDDSDSLEADARALLRAALRGELPRAGESSATCHVSAVDADGLACSVTVSAGYGSGDMAPGTGIWLNNSLGELELNKRGLEPAPPGSRLRSNMAPTVAWRDGELLAIGSPGADRITTAILQVLVNHLVLGQALQQAVDAPRAHVEFTDDGWRVAHEPGLAIDELGVPARPFPSPSMFFGGVGAAAWHPARGFSVAADPRRSGGTWHSDG